MTDVNDPSLYAGPNWNPVTPYYTPACLGDARDGVKLYTTNTTLTADVRASLIIVYSGVTLITAGWELMSQDLILNNGYVSADGVSAVAAVPGVGGGANSSSSGVQGGDGGMRANPGGDCNANGAAFTSEALGAAGGNGSGAGAGAGGANASYTVDLSFRSPFAGPDICFVKGYAWDLSGAQPYVITCGAGGGGANAGSGGTGGGGAGMNRLRARRIINNGIVSARGGLGSAATGVNGSGGGGGGGGRNVGSGFRYGNGRWLVTGGAGGAGNGTGTAGLPGASGTNHFFE